MTFGWKEGDLRGQSVECSRKCNPSSNITHLNFHHSFTDIIMDHHPRNTSNTSNTTSHNMTGRKRSRSRSRSRSRERRYDNRDRDTRDTTRSHNHHHPHHQRKRYNNNNDDTPPTSSLEPSQTIVIQGLNLETTEVEVGLQFITFHSLQNMNPYSLNQLHIPPDTTSPPKS